MEKKWDIMQEIRSKNIIVIVQHFYHKMNQKYKVYSENLWYNVPVS